MYPSTNLFILCGFFRLLSQSLAVSCPPSNRNVSEVKRIQFCSDSTITTSSVYLDSSDASSRVTTCTCFFINQRSTFLSIDTTLNQTDSGCKSKIKFGHKDFNPTKFCGEITLGIAIRSPQIYNLIFISSEVNLKRYCLHLYTDNGTPIMLSCFPDSYSTTNASTFTTLSTTTKGTTSSISTTDFATSPISIQHSETATFSTTVGENNPIQGLPLQIMVPAIGGGVFFVFVIIIIAMVCIRRKNKNPYEEPGPKADLHSYENQTVVVNDEDEDEDDMRENELYHSRNVNTDLQNTAVDIGGGYAEVESTMHGTEANRNTNNGLQNTSVDIGGGYAEVETSVKTKGSNYPTSNQEGPLYSMPVKKQKKNKEMENDGPVYAMPDKKKTKSQQNEDLGPVYAMVDKKNKKDNTKGGKQNVNKKPPVISPKPIVNSNNNDRGSGTVNEDGLHYSELELHDSNNGPSNSNFNISDKTGYAEVV